MHESEVRDWRGYDLVDPDGTKIGTIDDFFVDRATERPEWALVTMGLFGMKQTLVPFEGSSVDGDRLRVPYDKAVVKDAPTLEPGETITEEQLSGLYSYYRLDEAGGSGTDPDGDDADLAADSTVEAPAAAGVTEADEADLAKRERELRDTQEELRDRQADLEGRQDALERREADLEQRVEDLAERESRVEGSVPAAPTGAFEREDDLDRRPADGDATDDDRDAMVGAGRADSNREVVAPASGSTGRLRRFGEG